MAGLEGVPKPDDEIEKTGDDPKHYVAPESPGVLQSLGDKFDPIAEKITKSVQVNNEKKNKPEEKSLSQFSESEKVPTTIDENAIETENEDQKPVSIETESLSEMKTEDLLIPAPLPDKPTQVTGTETLLKPEEDKVSDKVGNELAAAVNGELNRYTNLTPEQRDKIVDDVSVSFVSDPDKSVASAVAKVRADAERILN